MIKTLNFLKKLMYWLTVVMPLIDAGRTVVRCVYDGIEQGRKDVEEARSRANEELFESSHRPDATSDFDFIRKNF